jgi:hypothetical protein
MSIKGHITCHITGTKGLITCQVQFKCPIAPLTCPKHVFQNMFWNAKVKRSEAKGRVVSKIEEKGRG